MSNRKMGQRINDFIAKMGIDAEWLSSQTGISSKRLSSMLSGGRIPFEHYFVICDVLKVRPDFFF